MADTPSNTTLVGALAKEAPAPEKHTNPQLVVLKEQLAVHQKQNSGQGHTPAAYLKGINAFIKAFDIVLRVKQDWAYQTMLDYFIANADTSCREENALRGIDQLGFNQNMKIVTLYNLFRARAQNYNNSISEDAYVAAIGDPDIVLWVNSH